MDASGNKNSTCLIIAGGEFAPLPEGVSHDFVIACDRGYEYAEKLGITPDFIVGDFDSAKKLPDAAVPVLRLPPEKDDTDTMCAVKIALRKGFGKILIACALGGRLDHTLANVQTAVFVTENGAGCILYGKDTVLTVLKNGSIRLPEIKNAYLSVFSLSEKSVGVSIEGTRYPLENGTLTCFPLGVSNEWSEEEAVISVKEGMLAIVTVVKD